MPSRDSLRTQLLKGTTAMLVLEVLADGEAYGYEIVQEIAGRSDGSFVVSEGSLYPALHKLEADGAVVASWRESDRGPRRRYYRITPKGQGLLAESREQWAAVVATVGQVSRRPADA